MSRKRYADGFKIGAAKLVREQGYTVKKAAENLGVDSGSIRRWVHKLGSVPSLWGSGSTAEGIRSKAKRPSRAQTTDSRHDHPVAANILNREFYPERADEVWTADITYVPTAEGWPYLAVVLDLFSRRIIGWATADHLRAELTCDARVMALKHRRPKGELLHHSDRGVRYASKSYQEILAGRGIEPSMSRAGNCHDNAVTESFFSTLKGELTRHESYASGEEARRSLFEYIEVFYNRRRLHSTLEYRSPVDFEVRFAS